MTVTKTHPKIGDRFRMNLKLIREKQKLTRNVLADIMGINPEYLAQLERGQRSPSLEMIELTARALDVDMSRLLEEP